MDNGIFKKSEQWDKCYEFVSLEITIEKDIINIEDKSSGTYGESFDKKDFIRALRDFADFLEKDF